MKRVFGIKLIAPLLLVCVGLGFGYQSHRAESAQLRSQYQQIEIAARNLELPVLQELSAASRSDFQQAYIQYRLGLAAEKSGRLADMDTAFSRSLTLLNELSRLDASAEIYALSAAIHLKQISRGKQPELHRTALDNALTLGQQLDPKNPGLLLVAAEAMHQVAGPKGAHSAMAELLKHEAEIQLDRYCRSFCPETDSSYIWHGLAQAFKPATGSSHSLLAGCNSANLMTHGS